MKETKRIILTGGPSCGKTTVLEYLEKKGYTCIPETAREVLIELYSFPKKGYGELKEQMLLNHLSLQKRILEKQLEKESKLKRGINFLDRSAIDGIAYCKIHLGHLPAYFKKENFRERYNAVFLLDRFPLINDGLRRENDEEAEIIHQEIKKAYKNLGYNSIQVPIFQGTLEESVSARANFILKNLEDLNE